MSDDAACGVIVMPSKAPWTRIILAVLLLALGYGAYYCSLCLWGVYHFRAATEAVERRQFKEGSSHLRKCIGVWPDDPELRLRAASVARRGGDFDEADLQLQAHEEKKGDARARQLEYQLLRVHQGDLHDGDALLAQCLGAPDAAETPFLLEAFIEGSLSSLIPALQRGETHGGGIAEPLVMRTGEAVAFWLSLRSGRADQAQGYVWRGHVHAMGNHPAKAIDNMQQALDLDPDNFEARLFLAKFLDQDRPAEASLHFALLRKRFPDNREVQFRTATNLRALGKSADACAILDAMLVTEPSNVMLLAERGQVALDMRRPADAEVWLTRALAGAPGDAKIHLALASCLRKNDKEAEAQQHEDFLRQLQAAMRRARDDNSK
jgi:predicted Zn-dependent protease